MKKYPNVLVLLASFLFLTNHQALFADDPAVVGPDIYRVLFENDRVRVLSFHFKPGDKLASHSHPPFVAYVTSEGTLQINNADGTSQAVNAANGQVIWMDAVTHSEENIGSTDLTGIVIELKENASK